MNDYLREIREPLNLESSEYGIGTFIMPGHYGYYRNAEVLQGDTAKIVKAIMEYVNGHKNKKPAEKLNPEYMVFPPELEAINKMGEFLAAAYRAIEPYIKGGD